MKARPAHGPVGDLGTPSIRPRFRSAGGLAKWLGKPTCEHARTQSRLRWRQYGTRRISPENSRTISERSTQPAYGPTIPNWRRRRRVDPKDQRSPTLVSAQNSHACDLAVTGLEAFPLGRGARRSRRGSLRTLVKPPPRLAAVRCGGFPLPCLMAWGSGGMRIFHSLATVWPPLAPACGRGSFVPKQTRAIPITSTLLHRLAHLWTRGL